MARRFQSIIDRFTPSTSRQQSPDPLTPRKAPSSTTLFPPTNPTTDGEDCLHDCVDCTVRLPSKWEIDEEDKLYGQINAWHTHLVVATGKTDWVRDVADEEGSVMQAVGKHGTELANGKLMLSASNMPLPEEHHISTSAESTGHGEQCPTRVLVLPRFEFVEGVSPSVAPPLLDEYIARLPTNASPLSASTAKPNGDTDSSPPPPPALPAFLTARPCPHNYLILLCSQKTRDARCGQSAPLLRREFERHLRPLGLYRDLHDERPGGVGIYFISHVGGHKYAANVMVYRRAGSAGAEVHTPPVEASATDDKADAESSAAPAPNEAAQCIWLARVRPEHCENIIRYSVLQGKVVKPELQLRGGFDRTKMLSSW